MEPAGGETAGGKHAEATMWDVVDRLRGRGLQISMWEIQRAQDVVAYLFARLGRPPTDDELLRHLRPVLCAKESELALFTEVFRDSLQSSPPAGTITSDPPRRRLDWRLPLGVIAALVFGFAVFRLIPPSVPVGPPGGSTSGGSGPTGDDGWPSALWPVVVVASAVTVALLVWGALHKRLRRRRSTPGAPGSDVELRWASDHPLDVRECARTARALRTRTRETSGTLDVRQTVDASIRAGVHLTPRFVQHKRTPDYLAVIEQRSTHDLLATHHARIVDQIRANGVAVRRVALDPRSRLVIDPGRGRRNVETLQPTSERERILLFAGDRTLRDPLSGDPRPWLSRFDRWHETTRIGPDVSRAERLPVVDRALVDIRAVDPEWSRTVAATEATEVVPAVFGTGDEMWINAVPPSDHETTRALDLLATALGDDGWYWLSACALYPEIDYDLAVAFGRLLVNDDGDPVATRVDIALLAQLPWFRYAYMPDWLRATLIGAMEHGRLVELGK